MRRPVLITVAVLGVLIAVIGSTGLFAALTDTARTGTNTVDSASLAASADIRLANATPDGGGPLTCGTFTENLASGFFTVADVGPDYRSFAHFCVKNVGSQSVALWPTADELTDVDTNCTGDEALAGDTTCGGDAVGELSTVLFTGYTRWDTCAAASGSGFSVRLRDHTTPLANSLPGVLAPNDVACITVSLVYSSNASAADVQKAQSDRVTWRYKFRADVAP